MSIHKEVKYIFSEGRPAEDIMLFPATKGYITYCIIFKIYMYTHITRYTNDLDMAMKPTYL